MLRAAEHGCSCAALPGDFGSKITSQRSFGISKITSLAVAELTDQGQLQGKGGGWKSTYKSKGKQAKSNQILAEMSLANSRPGICCNFIYVSPRRA